MGIYRITVDANKMNNNKTKVEDLCRIISNNHPKPCGNTSVTEIIRLTINSNNKASSTTQQYLAYAEQLYANPQGDDTHDPSNNANDITMHALTTGRSYANAVAGQKATNNITANTDNNAATNQTTQMEQLKNFLEEQLKAIRNQLDTFKSEMETQRQHVNQQLTATENHRNSTDQKILQIMEYFKQRDEQLIVATKYAESPQRKIRKEHHNTQDDSQAQTLKEIEAMTQELARFIENKEMESTTEPGNALPHTGGSSAHKGAT
jgi:hypothetical protein